MKFCEPFKIISVIAAFMAAGPALPLAAQTVEKTFTLDEAVITGLHNDQEYLALQEQVSFAQQRINEARALVYPKIDFNASASRFNNEQPIVLSPSFNSIYLPPGSRDMYYTTRFSLWQYLYAGGKYTTNLRLAEINLSQAQSQADALRNKIVLEVKKSFYDCLFQHEKINACEKALAEAAAPGEKNNAVRGRAVLFAYHLKKNILEAKHDYEKCRLEFLKTVGSELNAVVDLSEGETWVVGDYDLNKCLARATQYRPELRQTQFEETIDSLRVNLSMMERYPTVTLGANYEWAGDNFPLNNKNWNATINFNVPIFDGWASWARIKQRRNQAREGKIRRAKIEDQIRFDVREAYMDYTFWRDRMTEPLQAPAGQEPEEKLEAAIAALETRRNAIISTATLEWAIGGPFSK